MTNEEKARALLGSPAGCQLILDVSENLSLGMERIAGAGVSFWLSSLALDWCEIHAGRGGGLLEELDMTLDRARDFEDLALEVVSNPLFDWWYEPLDLDNQIWTSPLMPYGAGSSPLEPAPLIPERWRKPRPPDADGDPVPDTYRQGTSTLRGGVTSEVTAYALYAADHVCAFPLAAWQIRFEQDVRVYEINHPADWHSLCLEFPHRGPDGRLAPNWREVSDKWDGVHITLGGALSCEQARYEADGEWSMMQFWHTEETRWLNRLAIIWTLMPRRILPRRGIRRLSVSPYNGHCGSPVGGVG